MYQESARRTFLIASFFVHVWKMLTGQPLVHRWGDEELKRQCWTLSAHLWQARNAFDPTWFLGAAEYLDGVFETADVEDFAADSVDRPPLEVAAGVLRRRCRLVRTHNSYLRFGGSVYWRAHHANLIPLT